jgi:hypothetical protein
MFAASLKAKGHGLAGHPTDEIRIGDKPQDRKGAADEVIE